MKVDNNVILLLTACINPNCNDVLAVKDFDVRKDMYIKSIKWYLEHTDYKLVFCENSGTDISDKFDYAKDRTEFLVYKSVSDINRTKGYKEMEILDYAYKNSKFISCCNKSSIVVKITGRLILLNINRIIKYLKKKNYKSCICAYLNGIKPWADCRFIFFTLDVFPILLSFKQKINESYYFEHATRDFIKKSKSKFIYPLVPANVDGVSGGFGVSYNISKYQYFKCNLKHQIRRFLFRLGVLPINI